MFEDLVAANHVLARHGVLDAYGHVSMRSPERPDRYFLSRSLAPELVTAADVVEYDLESKAVKADAPRPYLERFIHGAVYKARPEVKAVVHSHSPSVVPFAASSVRLQPIYHMAGFLGRGAPVFDIRDRFGDTDMLVKNAEQGAALAEILGGGRVALMRGHGFVAAAESIAQAVYFAIYTEMNARLQGEAIALGGSVKYLSEAEARLIEETQRGTIERPWELWKRHARGR